MLQIFKAPKSDYTDHYEKARFVLTWNINLMLVFILFVMVITFVVVEPLYILHYSIGLLLTLSAVGYLRFYKDYKAVAIVLGGLSYFLVISSMFFIPDSIHYIEPFWVMIIALYSYFVLGRLWGLTYILGNIVATSVYFIFFMEDNLSGIGDLTLSKKITMSMEFTACMLLTAYVVRQFIWANKYAEGQLKAANELVLNEKRTVEKHNQEKTVLLQEIHHRVKNNLQVITSLLRMQSNQIKNEEARIPFQDSINRIMTMSLIHQKMYEKEDLNSIGMEDYLDSMVSDLMRASDYNGRIRHKVMTEIQQVDPKSIIPIALIITELISNSCKHAFIGEKSTPPEITIALKWKNEMHREMMLYYFDNGAWKDKEGTTFGLDLIETLCEQMDGNYTRESNESGTHYVFTLNRLDRL